MTQSGYKTNRISHRRGLLHLHFKPNKYISVYLCFEFYRCLFLKKLWQYTCIQTQPHKVWEIFFVPSMQPYSNRYLCLAQNALTKITIKHTQMHTFIHRYDFQVIQPLKFICCLKEQGIKTTWLKVSWISWASFCKMKKVSNDNIEIMFAPYCCCSTLPYSVHAKKDASNFDAFKRDEEDENRQNFLNQYLTNW